MPDPLDDDHVLHGWAAFEGLVHGALELDDLAVVVTAVHGDDQLGLAVVDPPLQGIDREAAEHHGMDRPDLGTRQHGKYDLGYPAHVNRDTVTFSDAHGFDDVCHPADFTVHCIIGIGLMQLAILTFPD